jgi:competence protein ComGC
MPIVLLGIISVCLLLKIPSPGKKDGGRYISTKGCK